jgi:hypothetical protein
VIHIARRRKLKVDSNETDGFKIVQVLQYAKSGGGKGEDRMYWKQITFETDFVLVYSLVVAKFFKHKFDIKIYH